MKKIIIPTLAILAMAPSAFAGANQDSNINWFVGGNAAIGNILWSDEVTDLLSPIELAESNFGLGAEAGVRIGNQDKIYNLGFTFNYDYLFNAAADIPSPYDSIFSEITTGFSAISASFDNYIRINAEEGKRSDLVLGLGYARATERFSMETTAYGQANGFYSSSTSDDGDTVVFKIGINSQLTDTIDWNAGLRAFVPTNSDSDMDMMTVFYAGLRFNF